MAVKVPDSKLWARSQETLNLSQHPLCCSVEYADPGFYTKAHQRIRGMAYNGVVIHSGCLNKTERLSDLKQ